MSSIKHRHLGRSSSHRQALLRNLVTSLISQETISTTYAKAKEAQRLAEKLITLGKKNTNASRAKAEAIFYVRCCIFHFHLVFNISKTDPAPRHRNQRSTSPSSSDPFENATRTDPAATHVSCVPNHLRTMLHPRPSCPWSTDRKTCASP